MKNVNFVIFVGMIVSLGFWMCQSELIQSETANSQLTEGYTLKNSVSGDEVVMSFDVCDEPEPSALYLYSFGTNSFYITPKLDGSSGSESITTGALSCFMGAQGYTCDNGPGYSGVCCFTIDQNISCIGTIYQILEDLVYTVTPYVPGTSQCIGSSFDFSINDGGEIQSIRFCTNECFLQMCYGLNNIYVDINN